MAKKPRREPPVDPNRADKFAYQDEDELGLTIERAGDGEQPRPYVALVLTEDDEDEDRD
jgi:hypothetical protein